MSRLLILIALFTVTTGMSAGGCGGSEDDDQEQQDRRRDEGDVNEAERSGRGGLLFGDDDAPDDGDGVSMGPFGPDVDDGEGSSGGDGGSGSPDDPGPDGSGPPDGSTPGFKFVGDLQGAEAVATVQVQQLPSYLEMAAEIVSPTAHYLFLVALVGDSGYGDMVDVLYGERMRVHVQLELDGFTLTVNPFGGGGATAYFFEKVK